MIFCEEKASLVSQVILCSDSFLSTNALLTSKYMPETMHLMHLAWMFQIQPNNSLGLCSYGHDLSNLHRKYCGRLLGSQKAVVVPTTFTNVTPQLFAISVFLNFCNIAELKHLLQRQKQMPPLFYCWRN